ncbi:DUF4158 domain-containing protein [Nocardia carnea]|uniref:DUF4158 domain-containing protein n=1 Tax=Nocardia carnea TaxID=37328 RepID=UPI003D78F0F0
MPEYGRFGVLSRVELERFCYLDDEDRRLIAARRRDYNRLGFAVQVVTVRYLGMFLADPTDVPVELVAYLAEQLEIEDPSCLGEYMVRRTTRFEHQAEIEAEYGLVPFGEAEAELAAWIADQAWITGDGPKAIFEGSVAWCRARRVLLPGVTTLEKLVAAGREAAEQRLWAQLAGQISPSSAGVLLGLLEVPAGTKQRVSELDRLRKGVFRPSSKGMLTALDRVGDLAVAGSAGVDVSAVPPRRLLGLAQHGLSGKATQLRRMSREHRLAVLAATVSVLSARAVDDVLELFDLLMTTELLSKAERQSKEEKLRRYPQVSRNAGKLAEAVRVLLEMVEIDQSIELGVVSDRGEGHRHRVAVGGRRHRRTGPARGCRTRRSARRRAGRPVRDRAAVSAPADARPGIRRDPRRCAGAGRDARPGRDDHRKTASPGRAGSMPTGSITT